MNASTTWTRRFEFFVNGQSHVLVNEGLRVDVVRTALVTTDADAEGWSFRYHGLFGTEVHSGYRTQAEAKAAAVRYVTTPVSAL